MPRTLAEKLNLLAENIQEMVEDSHEMAIGLCEHYDALSRIAAGDFAVRAPLDSPNELIARLGQLINQSADSLMQTIEELRNKDHELTVANDTLSNIIEFLPDATFVIDRDKRIIAWNRAMEEMTGVSKENMLGCGDHAYSIPFYGLRRPVLIDLLDRETSELVRQYLYVQRKGATLFAEAHIPNFQGGGEAYFWLTASPLFDSSGERVGAIESVRNISDLKRVEQENARLTEELRHSQKMEAIGQLAGGIAHDFNNILTAIIAYGHMVETKSGDIEACRRYGKQIVTVSELGSKLTQDMLAFGRKQILDLQQYDLNNIVAGMDEMLQRLIREDVVMVVEPYHEPLAVIADVVQIQQVLMNLATNARDAMPDGGRLMIRLMKCSGTPCVSSQHDHDGGRHYAVLEVSDTGAGMNAETRERIFEPFFTTKQTGKGTGLGLSIVFGIILQHGGMIDVDSEPGHGTTFLISLPLSKETVQHKVTTARLCPFATVGGNDTILLIEDSEITRDVIEEVLQEFGYRVITAHDGPEALKLYREYHAGIDMIILDVILPHMNGREILEAIMAEGKGDVRYLFMSGYPADIIHSKCMLEPDLNFIAKPIMPHELLGKIRTILDKPR